MAQLLFDMVVGVGQIGEAETLEGTVVESAYRADRLLELLGIGLNKFAGDVAQRLRASEGRRQLQACGVAEKGPKFGHDAQVRARKTIDPLPVVADHRQVCILRLTFQGLKKAHARSRAVLEFVSENDGEGTGVAASLNVIGGQPKHVFEVDITAVA